MSFAYSEFVPASYSIKVSEFTENVKDVRPGEIQPKVFSFLVAKESSPKGACVSLKADTASLVKSLDAENVLTRDFFEENPDIAILWYSSFLKSVGPITTGSIDCNQPVFQATIGNYMASVNQTSEPVNNPPGTILGVLKGNKQNTDMHNVLLYSVRFPEEFIKRSKMSKHPLIALEPLTTRTNRNNDTFDTLVHEFLGKTTTLFIENMDDARLTRLKIKDSELLIDTTRLANAPDLKATPGITLFENLSAEDALMLNDCMFYAAAYLAMSKIRTHKIRTPHDIGHYIHLISLLSHNETFRQRRPLNIAAFAYGKQGPHISTPYNCNNFICDSGNYATRKLVRDLSSHGYGTTSSNVVAVSSYFHESIQAGLAKKQRTDSFLQSGGFLPAFAISSDNGGSLPHVFVGAVHVNSIEHSASLQSIFNRDWVKSLLERRPPVIRMTPQGKVEFNDETYVCSTKTIIHGMKTYQAVLMLHSIIRDRLRMIGVTQEPLSPGLATTNIIVHGETNLSMPSEDALHAYVQPCFYNPVSIQDYRLVMDWYQQHTKTPFTPALSFDNIPMILGNIQTYFRTKAVIPRKYCLSSSCFSYEEEKNDHDQMLLLRSIWLKNLTSCIDLNNRAPLTIISSTKVHPPFTKTKLLQVMICFGTV